MNQRGKKWSGFGTTKNAPDESACGLAPDYGAGAGHILVMRRTSSRYLAKNAARNIWDAAELGEFLGCPLTHHADISWPFAMGPGDGEWRKRFMKLRELSRKWLEHRGAVYADSWTVERASNGAGVHTHCALHVPTELAREFEGYLRHLLGSSDRRVLCFGKLWNRDGYLSYILKGVEPSGYDEFQVLKKHRSQQGIVVGKRAGTSRNIGAAARRRLEKRAPPSEGSLET
jgi:hypothetical protein